MKRSTTTILYESNLFIFVDTRYVICIFFFFTLVPTLAYTHTVKLHTVVT